MSKRRWRQTTIIPHPGLGELHRLLRKLRCLDGPEPTVRAVALQLSWANAYLRDGPITVSVNEDTAAVQGHIAADGSFVKTRRCSLETIIALRNLAAEPSRRFRRYGQETSRCPFCNGHLGFGELSSVIGYCEDCAGRLGWPHDDCAAERAEDELRRDITREIEADDAAQEDPRE